MENTHGGDALNHQHQQQQQQEDDDEYDSGVEEEKPSPQSPEEKKRLLPPQVSAIVDNAYAVPPNQRKTSFDGGAGGSIWKSLSNAGKNLSESLTLSTIPEASSSKGIGGGNNNSSTDLSFNPLVSPNAKNHRILKGQSVQVVTEMFSLEEERAGDGVKGFDPNRWISAAGVLEKKRDGRMRDGYAKRIFVLGRECLYYYLIPKRDINGYLPLLGDERGQVKLTDIIDISIGQNSEYCFLSISFKEIRKQSYLSQATTELKLRAPLTTGPMWKAAILKARDHLRGENPGSVSPSVSFQRKLLQAQESAQTSNNNTVTTKHGATNGGNNNNNAAFITTSDEEKAKPAETKNRISRASSQKASLGAFAKPTEELFPFYKAGVKGVHFALAFLVINLAMAVRLAEPVSIAMERFLTQGAFPPKASFSFSSSLVMVDLLLLLLYAYVKRVIFNYNSLARDARFTVDSLKRETLSQGEVTQPQLEKVPAKTLGKTEDASGGGSGSGGLNSCSTVNFAPIDLPPQTNGVIYCRNAAGKDFKLRIGPNYAKLGKKAPSADPLYELVGMDFLRSSEVIHNLAGEGRVILPPPRACDNMEQISAVNMPRLFIVNAQVPDKEPVMIGKAPFDPGYSLVFYFSIKPATVAEYLQMDASPIKPALHLLKRYVHEAGREYKKENEIRKRFKAIGMADNIKDLGMHSVVQGALDKYNGKPAICNKVVKTYKGADWFEVDISIYDFPFLARKTLSALRDRVIDLKMRTGFVIQGDTDEELPEILLGGAEIAGLDFRLATEI